MRIKSKHILFFGASIFFILTIFIENININSNLCDLVFNEDVTLNEKISEHKKKIIYLTFDDGPSSKVTNSVLDVLKENKVHATFFLIGNQIEGKEDVVKRIYDEGNGIGLHTYTHKIRKIYSSEDAFIKEMIKCRDEINKAIGISPNIIRFPCGSNKRLNKKYLKRLHDEGFKIYDWDLDNTDGLNSRLSPDTLYRKAIKGSENRQNIILLLHCTDMHKNTCKALPQIIKYYKSKGYEFKVITEDTPELYFHMRGKLFK
ncbi:polysaccharide deacetylase family protein [Clostridium beijerinckii]|uniref:Peptidoglycan/xylan/chitin deacetylase (PgdA/CDA1 family) n=1 Tax=Clostridium beijerinckii TaxID=1520 RepID=A0A9Q5CJ05_CLOBE|nr:polysaccharide deacetylase family protein [Clostridium beijerinckii]AQS06235.1 peptidoglycan-N-acetylglucosamine deacetylase [Clostridium beijerinckii]MBA2886273.1 peptidoglycan/xylan/chitin deacetylase (PgdA/CDA1 family) [Clostridium beijerinckii]MBA2900869.1 peptidoglycan/xylan/chitin deacetylase (PgdA/CDA1 family) [Clostridium beijerinckii]MBA2910832.1 peptidoglycan/xylan/chitin deacetylase (PgdA/CDA1 family) [Clostridium beijerinckii]MBA9014155.1 peptidoglycan/xylan/chitin deacetylase (